MTARTSCRGRPVSAPHQPSRTSGRTPNRGTDLSSAARTVFRHRPHLTAPARVRRPRVAHAAHMRYVRIVSSSPSGTRSACSEAPRHSAGRCVGAPDVPLPRDHLRLLPRHTAPARNVFPAAQSADSCTCHPETKTRLGQNSCYGGFDATVDRAQNMKVKIC
jgi:hypothetical protein